MAEEIRPASGRVRAFAPNRAPADSGVRALSNLVSGVTDLAVDATQAAAVRELEDAEATLNSPTVTDEEIAEIVDNSVFEPAKRRARNRGGVRRANDMRAEFEDAARNAPDAIAARKAIQGVEQGALEGLDPETAAGFRDGVADFSRVILARSAERRVAVKERDETANLAAVTDNKFINNRDEFLSHVLIEADVERATQGNVPAFYTNIAIGLENNVAQDFHQGPHAVEEIDKILKSGGGEAGMTQAERKIFLDSRSRIVSTMERAMKAESALDDDSRAETHRQLGVQIELWKRNHGGPIPPRLTQPYIATAPTGAAALTAGNALEALEERETVDGVYDTESYKDVLANLRSSLAHPTNITGLIEGGSATLNAFQKAVRGLDPALRQDPSKLHAALSKLAEDIPAIRKAEEQELVALQAPLEERISALRLRIAQEPDPQLQDQAIALLEDNLARRENIDLRIRAHNNALADWANLNNVDLDNDVVDTLTP